MRFFKYKNENKNYNNALKEQYKSLTADEKRTVRKEKRLRKFSTIITLLVFFSCMFLGIYLISLIPIPDWWLWEIIVIIGEIILGLLLLYVSGIITFGLTSPLWKKLESFHLPSMKKEIFSKACSHLRDYYELQEPCIVTKCFESTEKSFSNHDVCIFVVRDELRITADLKSGFLYGWKDLGCYAFKQNEITILKHQDGKHLRAELNAGDVSFLFGYRAKSFIEKHFL